MASTTIFAEKNRLLQCLSIGAAWGMMMVASDIPTIIWRQFSTNIPIWLVWIKIVILLSGYLVATTSRTLNPLRGYLLILAAFVLGWEIIIPFLYNTTADWMKTLPIGWQLLTQNTIRLIPVLLMFLFLIGSRLTRKDLFLAKGDIATPVFPRNPLLFHRSFTWKHIGIVFILLAALVLPPYLSITLHPDLHKTTQLLINAPLIVVCAILNTTSEELQFRSLMLSRLLPALGWQQSLWLTSALFGLEHFYGQPSGVLGVLMAGIAGLFWGISVLRTKGIALAWITHFIQDVVIFSLLILMQ